jgi:hypothetical protein
VLSGVPVTSPLRTMIDIARFSDTFDSAERVIVRHLASAFHITIDRCRAEMDARTNLPNKRRALTRLSSALSSSDV